MKKKLLVLLLVLCAIVCFGVFSASAEETHEHCVCGGTPVDAAHHSCADVTWQPLPEGTTDFGKLAAGNYYLTGDVQVSAVTNITKDVKICLNGHNITTSTSRVFGSPRTASGKLTVTDCSYDAATKTWGGTITGGNSVYGTILYSHYSSTTNIYGGNWTGRGEQNRMGGLFVVAQDGAPDTKDEAGTVTLKGTSDPTKASTLNIYGGKIYGGYSGTGGNIHVMHCGKLNVYGGTITEGRAQFISWEASGSTSYKYGQGGNIFSDSGATIKIYGGEISNGTCPHNGTIKSTYSAGSGGNIYATGDLFIYGGSIFGGHAQQNTLTSNGAYVKTNDGKTAAEIDGRGGNIYATKNLTIAGGCIYDGKVNGLTGGNIYYTGGTGKLFTMSGGKIWGGEANADKDATKSSGLVNAYDVCGGSIRIGAGTFEMTGGSIGIDADGKPAGGTCYPSGSEAGNLYAGSSSITMNLSGGEIAYGNILGVNEDGTLIKGLVSKGGNIGGSAKYTYSGDIIVRDGYASGYGGNITLFNSGNTKIQGGTISGGEAKYGGNISMSGSGTTTEVLEITGGTIKNGKATNGGNVFVELYKQLEITDGTFEGGKTSSDGGSIYGGPNTVITITDSTFDGGECTGSGGGNIYTTGVITMEKVTLKNGVSKYAGANFRVNSSDYASVTLTDCIFEGGNSGSYGGNAYIADQATITGCTFKNGNASTSGGNLSINGTAAVAFENCTFENGTSGSTGGNVYLTDASNVTLTNCSMSGGRADDGADKKVFTYGGNLYSKSKTLTIQGGTYENGAAQSAGNMYLGGTTATVTGVTFKNGDATLKCDGTTNGNGGNIQSTSSCALTVTGCTFEGGKAMRGGSIAAFGQMNLVDCTVGGGEAASGGGTVFVYQKGYINITGNTEIFGGKVTNSSATGGTMNINSFEAAKPSYIGDGVKIHSGTAKQGSGIYLADGVLALAGNVQVENLWVYNMAETCYIDATDLNTTTPIQVAANYGKKIGISATDKSDMFTYVNGLVTYDNGDIKLVENAKINFSITLGGQREHSILLTNIGEMVMTIPNMTDCTVTYNGVVYTPDENGVITVTFPAGGRGAQYIITLTNNGEEGVNKKFVSTFAFAKGHMENPDTLVIGENTATLAAGNTTGYNYLYTAEKTGNLTITMPETGWMYVINNLTTYQYGDTQVYLDGAKVAKVAVTEGDELQIMVNTFDPTAPFAAPAGTITFTASYFNPVAEANGVEYESLSEALAAGGEVKLLQDIVLTEKTVAATTAVLDLNGCTLTTYAANNDYGFIVKGDLTIKGEGNVVVNGVYGIGVSATGKLTVEGGTFTTSADSDYMIGSWGTTTINGGTFTGIYCVLNNFSGTSTVTGGTFVTAEFDASGAYEACDLFANAGLTVTGGTFSKDVTEYCADYLAAFDNGDGTWYIGDAVGSANNPAMVEWTWNEEQTEATASVTVPAGLTYHYTAYVSGMELTINGEVYGMLNGSRWMPATFTVTNDTEEEATFELKIYYPVGSQGNPAELVIGENTAAIAEGNTQGYFFTYTAPEDGTLVITMPETGWMYVINNMTTYQYGDMQWSDSDPVVNPGTVTVNKGDALEIMVNAYDPANPWTTPAAELTITAEFQYAPGTAQNPIVPDWAWNEAQTEATASIEIPGGKTYHFTAYVSGMELTVNGESYGMLQGSRWMPASFTITNEGETATYELKISYPIGAQGNPAQLVIGENTAAIAEGNNQGYFFTYTAPEDGTLSITMPETGWMYVINNMTTYQYGDTQWSDSDPVVNPGTVTVNKGDVLEIMVNAYDPANPWTTPAAELTITADFAYAAGTAQNPIFVEWTWNEEQTEATASVTVPAGKTYNFAAYVSGMEMTINGEVYGMLNGSRWMPASFTITNDGAEAATYELKIYYPAGTQMNPAQLVIGNNTAVIAEGNNQGYFFTYTATETGALVITMPAGDWMYVINNMTTYQYGDMQWSDSDPVVNPAVVSVTEGDVLEIMVNSYDPANQWSNPAAEITFTAATSQFIAQVGEKQYVDLATAVKEANGETVVLLQDLVLTEKLVLEGTATLDMNWCTITTAEQANNYSVVVKGNLTLDGYGTWNVNGVYGIGVTGSLTINNGYFYASENNDYLIGNWGTTTVYGGGYYGIYCVINNFAGTTVIDGGEFNTEEFDYTGEYESCDVFADAGLTIVSGMFSKDVTEYCAEGKVCTDTGYGMYTVNDPVGTETNPVVFYDLENTVVNTGTMYYMTHSEGLIMTITGAEGYSLTIGGETIVPVGGVYTTVVTMEDFMPLTFAITGEGEFTVNFVYPIGAPENPDSLVIGENTTTVGENSWGYYYTWTATENGTLTITGTEGMQYNVNNLTSYVYGEYVYGAESYSVAVATGDEIQVSVNTYNPESWWNTPAGDITFTASFEGEGGSEPEGPVVGEGVTATPDAPIMVEYTAETAGILSVTVSGTPGFKVEVYDADGNTVGLPATGKAEETLTYELTAGTYTIRMVGYANWDEASATINYSISFTADEGGETEKAEYEVDYNTTLVVGDNTVTLLETAITTIYAFEPTEEGTYTITAPEGAIVGYWGAGEWFLFDPMSTTNSTEWKCTSVGQAAYIGISGVEGEFTVTVEKTAEGEAPEQIEYAVYENVHTFPAGFNTLTGEETLLNVNITEAHTAVLGTDGYYHLDSATGPVLYVDLQTDAFNISVAAAPGGANVMRGEVDGVKYDFLSAMTAYNTCDVYPLTEDTMKFIQGYGKYQGWFVSGLSPFAEINEGTANADTAWMVLCRYVEVQEPEIEKFDIDVARMILGNALEFQFGVAKTKIPDKTGYYAIIEKTWADGTTTEKIVPAEQWGDAGAYHAVIYDGLAAKEMGDTFYVTIYNANGQAVSNARTDSVRDYVARTYSSQKKATGKTMMVDMLNYGAAAQLHFGYGTDNLANKDLTDEQKASATVATPEMNNNVVKGTNYTGSRFILSSRIQVQVGFKKLTADMYAIYTYTNNNGELKEIRVEGKDFVDNNGTKIGVELNALVYADARALVDIVVYNADGSVHATASDSIESACARNTTSDDDVFVALMKFADAAKAHLYG